MSTWPNLFIAGPPRSGTTTLHNWIEQHPDVAMSRIKEPHFFSGIEFPEIQQKVLQVTQDKDAYLDLFQTSHHVSIKGESSSHYLADPDAPERIHAMIPNARIIVILRDPIQRAYSHYLLYGRRGKEISFSQVIRSCIERMPPYDELVYNIVDQGCYFKHLQRYYKWFSKEQILTLSFPLLHENPENLLEQICEFLGVDVQLAAGINTDQTANPYMQPSNQVFKKILANETLTLAGLKMVPRPILQKIRYGVLLKSEEKKPEIDKNTRRLLTEIYEPELDKLDNLLGENLNYLRESFTQ